MALFGIVPAAPPPPPVGQHARGGAVITAGAIKQEKGPGPLKRALDKLSLRERVMLGTLLALVIIAAAVFLVILPATERLDELESEIEFLEQQKSEIRIEPDLTPQYREAYEVALRDYENYQHFYYPFMDPEVIDRTVTDMLLDHELAPMRLTMSAIEPAELPLYAASQTLVPRPVPTVEDTTQAPGEDAEEAGAGDSAGDSAGEGAGDSAGEGATANAETDAAGDPSSRTDELASAAEEAATGEPTDAEGAEGANPNSLIYCYTVEVEARGWMKQLFSFLNSTRGITALEIVSYSYAAPTELEAGSGGISSVKPSGNSSPSTVPEEPEGGTIVMQIKLYVFVGGDMTAAGADND